MCIRDRLHTDYTVIEAADGSEGIRKAMKYVTDLIISDAVSYTHLDVYKRQVTDKYKALLTVLTTDVLSPNMRIIRY